MFAREKFTDEETAILSGFFTNVDSPVFALLNLPEVVKGALFARYSRSPKSLRRLFLDEFYNQPDAAVQELAEGGSNNATPVSLERAEGLFDRVFFQYGDDSVAQLGGAHIAVEQASNILTKVLEWGRLAAYLEQSTRYMFYDQKLEDRYRYTAPPEVESGPLAGEYAETMDWLFDEYSALVHTCVPFFEKQSPKQEGDSNFIYKSSIRAKACDVARGLLPAATFSNVGIFASGQAYESMLIRMNSHPLGEARDCAGMMLKELRRVIPSFLKRVDLPDRGGAWSNYYQENHDAMERIASRIYVEPEHADEVTLVEWDPEAEDKIAAAALYAHSDLTDTQLHSVVQNMSADDKAEVIRAYVGDRQNRRHKPGRGMERSFYRFDVLSDFGSFRDLQRHRMMTFDWQRLGVRHGYSIPPVIEEVGWRQRWDDAMGRMTEFHGSVNGQHGPDVAQYVVPFGFRLRYSMQFNAREAFHMLELRTTEQGHPDYRRVCQAMHTLIREKAGHVALADAMSYTDHDSYDLGRLESERRAEKRRKPEAG
ncbi:MAG: FAD-dependent thymidylate synthase [Chloroflexi bacterium]|nr:FAD-dependent thymidylate synthase [Chloroflexota bacterium]